MEQAPNDLEKDKDVVGSLVFAYETQEKPIGESREKDAGDLLAATDNLEAGLDTLQEAEKEKTAELIARARKVLETLEDKKS